MELHINSCSAVSLSATLEASNISALMNPTSWNPKFPWKFNVDFLGYTIQLDSVAVVIALFVVSIGALWLCSRKNPKGCLAPKRFKSFKLIRKNQLSHNTFRFRFALPTPNSVLGLPVGQHIRCRGKDSQGKEAIRPYTPITLDSDHGYFELVVKVYPAGRMLHHFREMRVGDYMTVKGPMACIIAPDVQHNLGKQDPSENPKDRTKIHLIYANVTVKDILLKEELDGFAQQYPNRFKVYYVLSQPEEKWDGGVGHINKEMIQKHCPKPASDIKILKCGPPAMNKAMTSNLNELGYTPQMQFEF